MSSQRGDWTTRLVVPVIVLGTIIFLSLIFWAEGNDPADRRSQDQSRIEDFATVGQDATTNVRDLLAKNRVAEDTGIIDKTGQSVEFLSRFDSGRQLLVFFTSRCRECDQALKDVNRLSLERGLKVTLVAIGEKPETARDYLSGLGLENEFYLDTANRLFNSLSATMPSVFVINNGMIEYFFPGRASYELLNQLPTS